MTILGPDGDELPVGQSDTVDAEEPNVDMTFSAVAEGVISEGPPRDPTLESDGMAFTPEDPQPGEDLGLSTGPPPDLQPPSQEGEPLICETAFVMFLDAAGNWFADTGALKRPIFTAREANFNDFYAGTCIVQKDIMVSQTANGIMQLQQQMAQQMVQQQQAQKTISDIMAKGGPRGGMDLSGLRKR